MSSLITASKKSKRVKPPWAPGEGPAEEKQPNDGFGPRQRLLIRAMKSGKHIQCRGRMHDGRGYDILGLACKLAGCLPVEEAPNVFTFGKEREQGGLPASIKQYYGFFNKQGGRGLSASSGIHSLTFLNDNGWSFRRLATLISDDPSRYFHKKF